MTKKGLTAGLVLALAALAVAQSGGRAVVNGPSHEGTEVRIDLPKEQHVKNFGAPADGKGLCVFTSLAMAGRWHNVRELFDLASRVREGGGWPEKVDRILRAEAPGLEFVQYEGTDPAILDKAMSEGLAACVTYGTGERYGGQTIYHMVLLAHLDAERAAIVDNNFPGTWEWMSRDEFLRRWKHPQGQGWAVVLLTAPPPPIPRN